MQRRRRQAAAWIVLFGCFAFAGWRLAMLDYAERISTDVLDLIPGGESAPELSLVRALASEKQARVVLMAVQPGDASGRGDGDFEAGVDAFIETLRRAPVFDEVLPLSDPDARETIGAHVFENRMELLLPQWLEERAGDGQETSRPGPWSAALAAGVVRELEEFLRTPAANAFEQIVPSDPLLLLPRLFEALPAGTTDALAGSSPDAVLIWASLRESPLAEPVQEGLFAAITAASHDLHASDADAQVRWTSIARFAAASRTRIKTELGVLNAASILAVLVVTGILLRHIRDVLHLLPVVLLAIAGAWCFTLLLFDRLPVMVLIVGSLLAGVAIDYGFHLFGRAPDDTGGRDDLRVVLRPLMASALTTIVGFSVLLFSELPVIRAIGVFVVSGLACALGGALLWYYCTNGVHLPVRSAATWSLATAFPRKRLRPIAVTMLLALLAVAAIGPWRLHWHDDIRELEIPSPELTRGDAAVRVLFGENLQSRVHLSIGQTPGEARRALEDFRNWVRDRDPSASVASLGLALPTEAAWRAFPGRLDELDDFDKQLRAALEGAAFDTGAFDPFFVAWRKVRALHQFPEYQTLFDRLAGVLSGPAGAAMQVGHAPCWFTSVVEAGAMPEPPPESGTIAINQLATLNRVFSHYREVTLRSSLWGALVAGCVVLLFFGVRRGVRILIVPTSSCLVTLGIFGLTGTTINLFHLLATLLAVCLSFDYAIFAADHAVQGRPPPPSIRLSGLTTAASFSVLAFSAIPVVSALGVTVAISVFVTLAALELLPALASPREGRP